jgi:ABC-type thiamine transport system ATPase subunit
MTVLALSRAELGRLAPCSVDFGPGLHAVIASPLHGADDFASVATGLRPPRRGAVRVRGVDPFRSPEARAATAALYASEAPLRGRTVEHAVAELCGVDGARRALGAVGLSTWLARRPPSLGNDEWRTVAMALCLSEAPRRSLLVLVEPLSRLPGLGPDVIERALRTVEGGDLAVVCVTASEREARRLDPQPTHLAGLSLPPTATADGGLSVRTADPRRLLSALSSCADIAALNWDGAARPYEIRVVAASDREASLLVMAAADRSGAVIEAITPLPRAAHLRPPS